MSKPLPTQNTFANLSPPWSLPNLDANFTNVFAAINDYGTYNPTLVDTGSVNALTVTTAAGTTLTLTEGLTLIVVAANTNTATTVTLNANGTGAKNIITNTTNFLQVGAIQANGRYILVYDLAGTRWRLLNPATASAYLVVKPANTSRTSTVTMTNDPDLGLSVPVGSYHFEIGMIWQAAVAGATPGNRAAPNIASGTVTSCAIALSGDANGVPITGAANVGTSNATFNNAILNSIAASPNTDFMAFTGIVVVSALSFFSLQWAQQNSSSNALTLLAGSYMKVTGIL